MDRGLPIGLRGVQVQRLPLLRGDGRRLGPVRAAKLQGATVLPGSWRVPQLHRLGRAFPWGGLLPQDHRVLESTMEEFRDGTNENHLLVLRALDHHLKF